LNKEAELTTELLQKMINRFNVSVLPQLMKYKNYYDGKQAILNKSYADADKPCSRTVINYCKSVADSYAGYMATPGYISYISDNDIEEVMNILRYNDYNAADAALLLDALVYGVAAELMYIDAAGQTRFRNINPQQCFAVCDDSLTGDLLYFVRLYPINDWDDTDTYAVDVYSNSDIKHYTMSGSNGYLKLVSAEPHYFSQCPANILCLPDEKSIYDCVMGLQDASNEILSSEIDEFSAFADAYMVLTGVDAEREDIAIMKENRVIVLPPDGATAQWLTKNANDAQVENILKRIHDSIYRISACVDYSSETLMNGVSSGIAIRYKMSGMENRAGIVEAELKKALQRRVEIICGIASLKLGEEVFRDITIEFKRNIPDDIASTIALINSLKGTVSDGTLLAQLDFIPDVNAELEAVAAQKQANMDLYAFGANTNGVNEDE
jgi:SPP1 family phage portal protein